MRWVRLFDRLLARKRLKCAAVWTERVGVAQNMLDEGHESFNQETVRPEPVEGHGCFQGSMQKSLTGLCPSTGSARAVKNSGRSALNAILAVMLATLLAAPAMAKEGDTFRPFVSLGYSYDSNLYRLSDSESLGTQRDDRYGNLSAGINVDWKPGRQQVVLKLTKTLTRYDRNTFLDFEGDDLQATWNWQLGNRLSGNLGASKSTSQSNFGDIGLVNVNNQVDRERRFGRAEWAFHPRWRIGGGVEQVDTTNSDPTQALQDFQQRAYDVDLSYSTPKGSNLRAQVRRINAAFPNPQILSYRCVTSPLPLCPPFPFIPSEVADNSYRQTEYNLLGDWRLSGKLALRGQAGWVDRKYENVLRGNLSGPPQLIERTDYTSYTGRVSADWYATGKTQLSVSAYQELGGAGDINASSLLKNGASVNGMWMMREKWRLNAGATYENRQFRGVPGTAQLQRSDDTVGASLSLGYAPIQAVSLDIGVSAGWRDSSMSVENYKFHSLFTNMRANF